VAAVGEQSTNALPIGEAAEGPVLGNPNQRDPQWPAHQRAFFAALKTKLNEAMRIVAVNNGEGFRREGTWPEFLSSGLVDPVENPALFHQYFTPGRQSVLTMKDFALVKVLFCIPEWMFPRLYPQCQPKCPWHNTCQCVGLNGMATMPRHAYGRKGVFAVWGRKYLCNQRKKKGEQPYCFMGYAPDVIARAPETVQLWWRDVGVRCTFRSAMSWEIIDDTIRSISHGSSLSAVRKQTLERYKEQHKQQEQLWISYVKDMSRQPSAAAPVVKEPFYPFGSAEYGGSCFSVSYLVMAFIETVESYLDYYSRKIQMIDGLHLKCDHSFKITKRICMDGERVFEAMFTIMNEYGQIVAYWLTEGSDLKEVRENLLALAKRYQMHGFEGPHSLTTDRCCQERSFWEGTEEETEETAPIFPSLKLERTVELVTVKTVVLPGAKIKFPATMQVANTFAQEILASLATEGPSHPIIFVDRERALSHQRADVVQVGLCDGTVYVFQLRILGRDGPVPKVLKGILENEAVLKCGNRFHNDVKMLEECRVHVKGWIELGHEAYKRGVSATRAPPLDALLAKLFDGAVLKKDGSVRCGPWDQKEPLTEIQQQYAACDSYATMMVYRKLMTMPIINIDQRLESVVENYPIQSRVYLFGRSFSVLIGHGTVIGQDHQNSLLRVKFDTSSVVAQGALLLDKNETITAWINNEQARAAKDRCEPSFELLWKVSFIRSESEIGILNQTLPELHTENRQVSLTEEEDATNATKVDEIIKELKANGSMDDKEESEIDDSDASIDSEDDEDHEAAEASLPGDAENANDAGAPVADDTAEATHDTGAAEQTRRQPARVAGGKRRASKSGTSKSSWWHLMRVKQDLLHLFKHWADRGVSKQHGAFKEFMQRLREAFFVVNYGDLEFIKDQLCKSGMSDEDIERKFENDFQWFLQRCRRSVPPPAELE